MYACIIVYTIAHINLKCCNKKQIVDVFKKHGTTAYYNVSVIRLCLNFCYYLYFCKLLCVCW